MNVKTALLFLLFSLVSIPSFSENPDNQIDSIIQKLSQLSEKEKIEAYNNLFQLYFQAQKLEPMAEYARKSLQLSRKYNDEGQEVIALENLATVFKYQTNADSSIFYYRQAWQLYEQQNKQAKVLKVITEIADLEDTKGNLKKSFELTKTARDLAQQLQDTAYIIRLGITLGYAYGELGDTKKSLSTFFDVIRISREVKNVEGEARASLAIGYLYFFKEDYEKSLQFYQVALNLAIQIDSKMGISISFQNMGNVYEKQKKPDKAIEYYKKALEIQNKLGDKSVTANILANIGGNYEKRGDHKSALEYLNDALRINLEIGDTYQVAINYMNIGDIYSALNKQDKAIAYLKKSMAVADSIQSRQILRALYQSFYRFYEKRSPKQALDYYQKYIAVRDTLYSQENKKQLAEIQTKYETAEKEKKIEIQKTQIRQQKMLMYGAVGGVLVLLIFSALLYREMQEKKRAFRNLTYKNEEVLQQQEEILAQSDEIAKQNSNITSSIRYAKRIQTALLPPDSLLQELLSEHFILYLPRDIVSGDFFWLKKVERKIIITVADCTGHGVPGAFMSMLGIAFLNELVLNKDVSKPSILLNKLREKVISSLRQTGEHSANRDGMDMAVCAIDLDTLEMDYAGANSPVFLVRKQKPDVIETLAPDKMPIGYYLRKSEFSNQSIQLHSGDIIYLFSDGYIDQMGGDKGRKFLKKRLKALLLKISQLPVREQQKILKDELNTWKNGIEQVDDILVLAVKIP